MFFFVVASLHSLHFIVVVCDMHLLLSFPVIYIQTTWVLSKSYILENTIVFAETSLLKLV